MGAESAGGKHISFWTTVNGVGVTRVIKRHHIFFVNFI
jgi:hypothetical protein